MKDTAAGVDSEEIFNHFCFEWVFARKKGRSVFDALTPQRVNHYLKTAVQDSFDITRELFTMRSMKVISGFWPFFITSLYYDERIHDKFYDPVRHLNLHHPSAELNKLIHPHILKSPFYICALLSLVRQDPLKRRAMRLFVLGAVLKIYTKAAIKEVFQALDAPIAQRPLSGFFNPNKKVHNAFPSGHAAFAAFNAVYLGLYKGPIAGIPLGLYALFIMGMRVAQNSHYLSQVVGGAAFGTLFGVSAYAVFHKLELSDEFSVNLASDGPRRLGVSVTYQF